ncbi:hypothetical protein Vadar_031001 [Vaccinium darrowii]|uniref:Uncharacterized protein n=1 Tax=Vaccinium darrowii TaxID=229202 RepID=A0ACB7Y9V4_9ERIC|nr:hypothetical protein Vadar_031001 [Vaccinium darrowii]
MSDCKFLLSIGMNLHGIVGMDPPNDGYFTNLMQSDSQEELFGVELQYFNPNAQVFTQETQFTTATGSISRKQQRGANFTIDEDELLVSAWLNISMDPVHALHLQVLRLLCQVEPLNPSGVNEADKEPSQHCIPVRTLLGYVEEPTKMVLKVSKEKSIEKTKKWGIILSSYSKCDKSRGR